MKNSINQLRLEILNDIKKIELMSNVKKNKFEKTSKNEKVFFTPSGKKASVIFLKNGDFILNGDKYSLIK